VELVRRFAARLDSEDVRVIGHYVVETPPPCERLPMPAVAISIPGVTFALRFDFGSCSLKHSEIVEEGGVAFRDQRVATSLIGRLRWSESGSRNASGAEAELRSKASENSIEKEPAVRR